MTVRWKPLLILSGLFLVIAVVGVAAILSTFIPKGSGDILPLARGERAAKQFDKAEIQYRRALQVDGKNPVIYEELASLYADWAQKAPEEKKADLRALRYVALTQATTFGNSLKEPRRELLGLAMAQDDVGECVRWSKEVLRLEPTNADAHFILANVGLDDRLPNIADVKRHLAAMESAKAPAPRIEWIKARLAEVSGDQAGLEASLARGRTLSLEEKAPAADRMALLRLRALDVQKTTDGPALQQCVEALQAATRATLARTDLAPSQVTRLCLLLERSQRALSLRANQAPKQAKAGLASLIDSIEGDVESLFQKALAAPHRTDLQVDLSYADHLRYREKRRRCEEVVEAALASPLSSRPSQAEIVLSLHTVAAESMLANTKDERRFEKAEPHLKYLLGASSDRFKGLGHLLQGAIDLERCGVAAAVASEAGSGKSAPPLDPKLRASALSHLKVASSLLPDVAEAQARYGVALVLTQEVGLGRQYLQNALRMGGLDPQYQVWAAWSMLQAGYPEEAAPIVSQLLAQVAEGKLPAELESSLHLLNGEILQARRSPESLRKAVTEIERSVADGQKDTPAVQLRLAQLDVQLGRPRKALERIEALRAKGQSSPATEHLAVLTLQESGRREEAAAQLEKARKAYPKSEELVGLEAALLAKADKPKEADRVLAEFLASNPAKLGVVLLRSQVLADLLGDLDGARKLLVGAADRAESSSMLVQLALLDMRRHDQEAAAADIAKIRSRWKEAAAADILDAQLAMDQGNVSDAIAAFDAALKKDPGNKLVQFWKAQLDSRAGATAEAARAFETIAKDRPTKEIESGQSLMAAAQSALANLALQNGDLDLAIGRFEDLRKSGEIGGLTRADRWQLATAYVAKGQWAQAKDEIAALLNDPKNPPSYEERVRGANLYRVHGENAPALAQLDYVLRVEPANPAAVVTRAFILTQENKTKEAGEIVKKAIEVARGQGSGKPPAIFFLMLAAVESSTGSKEDAYPRALQAVEEGLAAQPESLELVQAAYRLKLSTSDAKSAVAFVEAKAKKYPKGPFRRTLVDIYREQKDYASAERVLRELVAENPKDSILAANLVQLFGYQAARAGERGERDREQAFEEKAAALVRQYRAKFPNDLAFLQLDCDLATRKGDLARAAAVTLEMDKLAKNSPAGPLNRARIYTSQGRLREVAEAYSEALERNPRLLDARIQLAQADLKLGEADEALRQAKLVLEADGEQRDALVIEARALAMQAGLPGQVTAKRTRALEILGRAMKKHPDFAEAYHLAAEIALKQGDRAGAIATLKRGIEAVPDDPTGLALAIETLCSPGPDGTAPSDADLADAKALADAAGTHDKSGALALACAVGYHKSGQLERALPWAEKATAALDSPVAHLNYGDLLLSIAESLKDEPKARPVFLRAVDEYDRVLKVQAKSVEAVNNKAWILHIHLGRSKEALALAQDLTRRVDPSTLPPEFFDTLGAIQEALGQPREAEDSYAKGLRKNGEHPVLNYHMGRLIASDRGRASKAGPYLEKAMAGKSRLSPAMAADLASLVRQAQRN